MKKFMFKSLFMTAVLLVSIGAVQADELRKEFNHTFQVTKGHTLKIDTRFSNVDIVKNTADEIKVEAYIEVSNGKNGKKLIENFELLFNQSGNVATIETKFPKNMNIKNLDVHIKVMMPMYINTNLDVKYGSLYISELAGAENEIKVGFGNFKADVIASKTNEISLSYVDRADIGYIVSGTFDVNFSHLKIKKIDSYSGKSSYSEIVIDQVNVLNLPVTKFDEWEIGSVNSVDADSRYSEFEITTLNNSLVLNANFGEFDIERTSKDFELIKIKASYTDCDVNIDAGASYTIEAYGSYADIDVPDNFKGTLKEKSLSVEINGQVGESPKGKVTINTSFGDVDLDD